MKKDVQLTNCSLELHRRTTKPDFDKNYLQNISTEKFVGAVWPVRATLGCI